VKLESDPRGCYPIVGSDRIAGHRELISGAEDQVDRPGRGVIADLEAAENDTRRQQYLAETLMLAIRPVFVIDLEFRPKIFENMILESRVDQHRIAIVHQICMGAIAGRRQRGKAVLLADGRLNIEISPALAKRKRRLRDSDIVGDLVARADGVVAERLRDLEKAGNDVIAALLIGGNKAVFGQENRIIAPSVRSNALRRGGLLVRREAENDLGIVCGDELEAFAAAPIDDVVVVALTAFAVLLVEEVEAKFLLEARRHCYERRHPGGLGRLSGRNHVKPGSERALDA
jgi:hypothetical protein